MIRLTLIGEQGRDAPRITWAYFRITGGAVWTRPGEGPVVEYCGPVWRHLGVRWSGMRFEGKCRIVFGVLRDPVGASDLLDSVSIFDCTLCANGVPFAVYEPHREMWRGAAAETWWHSFRLESAELRSSNLQSAGDEDPIQLPGPARDWREKKSIN